MTWPLQGLGAITLFSEDLGASKRFYGDVLGLRTVYEDDNSAVFDLGNTIVNVLAATEAVDLIAPATVSGPDAGARSQLTIWVDDADATCAQLAGHGVTLLNGPMTRPWGQRTATFRDPAGHIWDIAQTLPPG